MPCRYLTEKLMDFSGYTSIKQTVCEWYYCILYQQKTNEKNVMEKQSLRFLARRTTYH